jgi:hypothetical protein
MANLVQLDVVDAPEAWHKLGFAVCGSTCVIDDVRLHLAGTGAAKGPGITAWTLSGLAVPPQIDGLATVAGNAADIASPAGAHPNGVVAIDHLVVSTPDIARTTSALEGSGLELRRTRNADTHGREMRQSFFKLGEVVLEVIGPPEPAGTGPARFLGLAFTSADLDATVAFFGDLIHAAKPAVQPGRRIATLDRAAGSRVAMAFMSPEPARQSGSEMGRA